MVRFKRRSVRVAIAVVAIGLVMAAVTTGPTGERSGPRRELVPTTRTVWSSVRGAVAVPLATTSRGGAPSNPGILRPLVGSASSGGTAAGASPIEAAAESVIGRDGRTDLIGDTVRYPNAAIGRLDFRQGGHSYWCTATLVSADTVLTAGHCVHDGLTGLAGWSTQVRFSPAAEGNRAPFGSCRSIELMALPRWYGGGAEAHDLGLVRLDCPIGDTVGWFGFRGVARPERLAGRRVHVRGYPGDKRWSTLWTMRDRIRVSRRLAAFYAADTYGGQSGSPVFTIGACNGGTGPCIVAVHAYGVHGDGEVAHARYNHGPRLDPARSALVAGLIRP